MAGKAAPLLCAAKDMLGFTRLRARGRVIAATQHEKA